jgi:hypothetical protein
VFVALGIEHVMSMHPTVIFGLPGCAVRKIAKKSTISFVISIRPSPWSSAPTGRNFMKYDIRVFFEKKKTAEKIHVSLKPNNDNGYFT